MAQKLTHWLLITLILSLGFGQLMRFEYFGLTIYLHDVLVVLIVSIRGRGRNLVIPPGLTLLLAGLGLGWLRALTLYPIADLLIPSLYTLRFVSYLALYVVIKSGEERINPKYFVLAGLITLGIGLLQYCLLPDMRVFAYLGWDDHLNRLTLPHFDPTFTAAMLVISSLSLAGIANPLPLAPAHLVAVLLTYSRSTLLSLALTCLFFIKNKAAYIALLIIMVLATASLPKRFGEGTNLWRTYSISSRLEADLTSIRRYRYDLLIGRGMNTLLLDAKPSKYPNHATSPNNSYLYLLATTGLAGLVGLLMFMKQIYATTPHKSLITFVLIASLFNNVLSYPFVLLWVLALAATAPTST